MIFWKYFGIVLSLLNFFNLKKCEFKVSGVRPMDILVLQEDMNATR